MRRNQKHKITTKEKIEKYITISQSPLGDKFKSIVQEYKTGSLCDSEFLFLCDKLYNEGWRKHFKSLQVVLNEAKKNVKTNL